MPNERLFLKTREEDRLSFDKVRANVLMDFVAKGEYSSLINMDCSTQANRDALANAHRDLRCILAVLSSIETRENGGKNVPGLVEFSIGETKLSYRAGEGITGLYENSSGDPKIYLIDRNAAVRAQIGIRAYLSEHAQEVQVGENVGEEEEARLGSYLSQVENPKGTVDEYARTKKWLMKQ